jgi:hypothetical protein
MTDTEISRRYASRIRFIPFKLFLVRTIKQPELRPSIEGIASNAAKQEYGISCMSVGSRLESEFTCSFTLFQA